MTELFSTILLRVTLAGAASAVALRIAGGGTMREVVKLAAGLLMLLALLQPLQGGRSGTTGRMRLGRHRQISMQSSSRIYRRQ